MSSVHQYNSKLEKSQKMENPGDLKGSVKHHEHLHNSNNHPSVE